MRWGHRLCRMGWHLQGSCRSSDLHRAVIHAELYLPKCVSHSDSGFGFFSPPRLQPNSGKR